VGAYLVKTVLSMAVGHASCTSMQLGASHAMAAVHKSSHSRRLKSKTYITTKKKDLPATQRNSEDVPIAVALQALVPYNRDKEISSPTQVIRRRISTLARQSEDAARCWGFGTTDKLWNDRYSCKVNPV